MQHILTNWQNLNWAGIGFVLMMVVFLPACGGVTHLIRRSGRRSIKIRAERGPRQSWFRALRALHSVLRDDAIDPSLVNWKKMPNASWLPDDEAKLQGMMRAAPLRIVPRPHECTIDFERSRMTVLDGGAVLGQCCVAGCETVVRFGRNIAHIVIEKEEEAVNQ